MLLDGSAVFVEIEFHLCGLPAFTVQQERTRHERRAMPILEDCCTLDRGQDSARYAE
jgi:hypothetical protein